MDPFIALKGMAERETVATQNSGTSYLWMSDRSLDPAICDAFTQFNWIGLESTQNFALIDLMSEICNTYVILVIAGKVSMRGQIF